MKTNYQKKKRKKNLFTTISLFYKHLDIFPIYFFDSKFFTHIKNSVSNMSKLRTRRKYERKSLLH